MSVTGKRIKMNTVSVYLREIGDEIERGQLGIPLWQRRFVWTPEQVIDLFDSISHGYPIGSFLLWTRDSEWKGSLGILTSDIDREAEPKTYILDGRQRITAFYGCTSSAEDKDPVFRLCYDLRQESFCYQTSHKNAAHILRVSDIFDTFLLLGCLQQIQQTYPPEVSRKYIERAKELNSRLQEYVVSKITIGDCDLDEATLAFSRLNSKGTDISKTEMMQALCYTGQQKDLLVPVFEQLAGRLAVYGFDAIPHDDILNYFLYFDGRELFRTNIKELEKARGLMQHKDDVERAVTSAVRFLYEHCGVISWKLLPYRRQLLSLVIFFRHHTYDGITTDQTTELKRWFFHTSLNRTFQNSSLGIVSRLFSDFEKYAAGEADRPITYDGKNTLDDESFTFSSTSALFKLMMICQIDHYRKSKKLQPDALNYSGHLHFGSKNPEAYFPILTSDDKTDLNRLFNSHCFVTVTEEDLTPFCLDVYMLDAYRKGDTESFERQRRPLLLRTVNALLGKYLPK